VRRAVRKFARPVLIRRAEEERARAAWREYEERSRIEESKLRAQAAGFRHAIVHAVPGPDDAQAAVLLDVEKRAIRGYLDSELSALTEALAPYEIVAGLQIRELLETLGVDPDRRHLVEMMPSQKSMRLNRAGRMLRITPELVIASTTGISRPLGDPSKVAQYLSNGETGKLRRRLESDAKALYAFYRYGALHGYVRLRWGFLNELLPADFAAPGETRLHDILKDAMESGFPAEIVIGTAPGWADPWSRARRVEVLEHGPWDVRIREDGVTQIINKIEIQAARLVE
jgi:hypothetical protein